MSSFMPDLLPHQLVSLNWHMQVLTNAEGWVDYDTNSVYDAETTAGYIEFTARHACSDVVFMVERLEYIVITGRRLSKLFAIMGPGPQEPGVLSFQELLDTLEFVFQEAMALKDAAAEALLDMQHLDDLFSALEHDDDSSHFRHLADFEYRMGLDGGVVETTHGLAA